MEWGLAVGWQWEIAFKNPQPITCVKMLCDRRAGWPNQGIHLSSQPEPPPPTNNLFPRIHLIHPSAACSSFNRWSRTRNRPAWKHEKLSLCSKRRVFRMPLEYPRMMADWFGGEWDEKKLLETFKLTTARVGIEKEKKTAEIVDLLYLMCDFISFLNF